MTPLGRILLAGTALLGAALSAPAQQAIELKPKWIMGKRYAQTMETQQVTKMTFPAPMEQKSNMHIEMETDVVPHEDAAKRRLILRYKRMMMDMEMAGQKMHFDSSHPDPANDQLGMGKAFGAFVGKEMRLVIDQKGKILEFENMDELTAALTDANPLTGQIVKGMMNKETIAQSLDQASFKALPGKPVKAGDSWPYTVNMALAQLGTIGIKGTYTVTGLAQRAGANCVEVKEEGQLTMDLGASGEAGSPTAAIASMGMKIDKGTIKGTSWFDPELGMTREAQFQQTMTMQMKNPTAPDKTLEMPMTQTISIKLTAVGDVK